MKNNKASLLGLAGGVLGIITLWVFVFVLMRPLTGFPQLIVLFLYVGMIILSITSFAKENPGLGTKAYFSQGFKTFIVFTLLMVAFTFVYYSYDHTIMEAGIKENALLQKQEGNRTNQEIENNSAQIRKIFMPVMLSVTTIILLFLGALTSLLTAVFAKNK